MDEVLLGSWFEAGDHIDALEGVQVGAIADRDRVAYRLRVSTPDGMFLVEQEAHYGVENGRIGWLRILCSGYRPSSDVPAAD